MGPTQAKQATPPPPPAPPKMDRWVALSHTHPAPTLVHRFVPPLGKPPPPPPPKPPVPQDIVRQPGVDLLR